MLPQFTHRKLNLNNQCTLNQFSQDMLNQFNQDMLNQFNQDMFNLKVNRDMLQLQDNQWFINNNNLSEFSQLTCKTKLMALLINLMVTKSVVNKHK